MGWEQVITLLPSSNNGGWVLLSHAVGLEQKRKLCFYFRMLRNSHHPTQWAKKLISVRFNRSPDSVPFPVTIPHGGLRTGSIRRDLSRGRQASPSHTVGSEQEVSEET